MSSPLSLSVNAEQVRRLDRDRFATALFAPAERREPLFALYAFNIEVARVRETVSEPLLGRIRLQWWREALDTLYAGNRLAHPVAEGLLPAIPRLSRPLFDRLLDAREGDLDNEPPADLAGLEAYAEATSATLNGLALAILGVANPAAEAAARHLGVAWALTGLLRAVPFHAASGRLYLPAELLAEHGVSARDVMAGRTSPGLAKVAQAIAERARHHLDAARHHRRQVPREALPGLLTGPLADRYLRALDRSGGNLMDSRWSAIRPRPLRLAWHALRGRY
jgi:NADH dehydrogenase [ubiquinone] 1 alpha subcomplex assembly factor 6